MALFLVTAPQVEPVSLAAAKLHMRVDHADDDALITALITAAREFVENFTTRALIDQVWDLKLDGFPCSAMDVLELPMPPVTAISSITYTAADGTSTTWASGLYVTELPVGPKATVARITPVYNGSYPVTRNVIDAVVIRFTAGYGGDATAVPQMLIAAMKLLIGHWFENREAVVVESAKPELIPLTIAELLWPFKVF